ncbi:MAG: 5'-methylthioadenosine/S-adenosylhomocysteine nucleosidase [Bacilli bacterium]|nr:5'-methylthioadenosine/S-adenosylhomocysteine nucleosidase [Bacilli bacterium]
MKKIAIICAFDEEVEYFIHKYNLEENKRVHAFIVGEHEVLLTKTGVGKVNAASAVQKVIDTFKPDCIINSGCSGAISKDLPIYGVVISDEVFYHDFYPENIMRKYTPGNGEVKASEELIEVALRACKLLHVEDYVVTGIATGDCYVTESGKVAEITKLGAKVVDMESAAVGHVCALNEVPFVCIRSISDYANGTDVDEIESSRKAAKVTEQTILLL